MNPGPAPRSTSLWRRSRYACTAVCVVAAVSGLVALSGGHWLHGGLLLLATAALGQGSVLGRRGRRTHAVASVYDSSLVVHTQAPLRKAA